MDLMGQPVYRESLLDARVNLLVERLKPVTLRRVGLAVAVVGEAGVGKTYTVQGLLTRLPCRSATAAASAGPAAWADALPRPVRSAHCAERSLERVALGQTLGPADLAAALASRLKGLAPFVLLLEDVHDADDAASEALTHLAEAVRRVRGAALLVTSREELPSAFVSSKVEPLDGLATREMLEAEAGGSLPDEAFVWMQTKAAGHPLYALEYFRYLSRLGHLWNDGRIWRWRSPAGDLLPASVEALVEQRLDQARSSEPARRAIAALALLGAEAQTSLWARVAGLTEPEIDAASGGLKSAGVLLASVEETGTGVGFAHPLFREVTLRTLDPTELRDMARRAVEALKGSPLEAARFTEQAGLSSEEVLPVLIAAADASVDPLAAARLRAAASRRATGAERARLAYAAAKVLENHDLGEAQTLFEVAVTHPDTLREALLPLVHILALTGKQREADELADRLTRTAFPEVHPAALHLTSRNVAGDHQGAWAVWQEFPELQTAGSPELLRAATAAALATGRMADARDLIERGLTVAGDVPTQCELLSLRALIQFHTGDPSGADATMAEVLDLLGGLDVPRLRATALLNRAAFLRMRGEYEATAECLEESLRIRQGSGDGKAYAFAMVGLADLRIEQGRFEQAEDLLTEAVGTLELYGPDRRQLIAALAIASKLGASKGTRLGRLTGMRQAERALSEARRAGNTRLLRETLIDAALALAGDQAERALVLVEESAALAEAAGASPTDAYRESWAAGLAQMSLGHLDAAESSLGAALEIASKVEGAIEMHKIGLQLARLRTDVADAKARLAWFETRSLNHGATLARELFPELDAVDAGAVSAAVEESSPWVLEVLGPVQLRAEGPPTKSAREPVPLRGEKRRLLLSALLEARASGRQGVSRLDLMELIYPGQDEVKANISLRQLVLVLRREFGLQLVITTADGYALGACDSDLDRFLAEPDSVLWRGPYLGGMELDGPLRDTLHLVLARFVQELSERDPQEAARLGTILFEAEPYRRDYLAIGLDALRAAGNHRSLAGRYRDARAQSAELGVDLPERWQDFLVEEARERAVDHYLEPPPTAGVRAQRRGDGPKDRPA